MGRFTGANLHVVYTLKREFDRRKEQIRKMKEDLENTIREHEAHVTDLMKTSEDKYNEIHVKSASLQVELQNEKIANDTFTQKIASLEKQCKDATSSSFSMFSE